MSKLFYAAVFSALVCLVSACSKKMNFTRSVVVPTAEGDVKIKKDRNNNYEIHVSVLHLAQPNKLQPPKQTYVVWMETKEDGLKNIGQLKSSSGFLSKTLKASLSAISSFKPRRFFCYCRRSRRYSASGAANSFNYGIKKQSSFLIVVPKANWSIFMIMNLSIVSYSDLYKQQVIDLIVNIQRNEFHVPITPDEQPDLQDIPGFYQNNKGNFWVAITGTTVVGTVALLDIGNNQGALRKMFVKADFRGKEHGAGQGLLNTLLTWAGQKEFAAIYLGTTSAFLAAHRFYEKNNFQEVPVTALPAAFPVMAVDVKFYKYDLYI